MSETISLNLRKSISENRWQTLTLTVFSLMISALPSSAAEIKHCSHGKYGHIIVNTTTNTWKDHDGSVVAMRPRQSANIYDLVVGAASKVFINRGEQSILLIQSSELKSIDVVELNCHAANE